MAGVSSPRSSLNESTSYPRGKLTMPAPRKLQLCSQVPVDHLWISQTAQAIYQWSPAKTFLMPLKGMHKILWNSGQAQEPWVGPLVSPAKLNSMHCA